LKLLALSKLYSTILNELSNEKDLTVGKILLLLFVAFFFSIEIK